MRVLLVLVLALFSCKPNKSNVICQLSVSLFLSLRLTLLAVYSYRVVDWVPWKIPAVPWPVFRSVDIGSVGRSMGS